MLPKKHLSGAQKRKKENKKISLDNQKKKIKRTKYMLQVISY
jgi:hypothetical protein